MDQDANTKPNSSTFMFGAVKIRVEKSPAESNKRKYKRPRKINPYVIRDQELKMEESKHAQKKIKNWKRRQHHKLERDVKVMNVSVLLMKRFPGKPKNKKKRTNKGKYVTTRVRKRPKSTTHIVTKEEPWKLCLEKLQQSSPAVMFARLRSNRRYKPGD